MKKLTGKEAIAAYSPTKGHSVVIYTHKFKSPEDFQKGVQIVTNDFPTAQLNVGQKRHNIFISRPRTNEIVNVSFFDEGADVNHWHKSQERAKTLNALKGLLDGDIGIQVFEVDHVIGIS
jgi:antibiotic biosynthesis monooxygenase (ABM) superfamily enzyme